MNKNYAIQLAGKELEPYRDKPYDALVDMITTGPINYDIVGEDRKKYHIEIEAYWDDRREGNIRVVARIDDGGWRAYSPFSTDFIKGPSGAFIGE